jgi:parallel beta-helix repeat protein
MKFSTGVRLVALALGVLSLLNSAGTSGVGLVQKTITVCPEGPPKCDFAKIQDAINAANEGDTVQVGAGTYAENVVISKSLTLRSAGREQTVIKSKERNRSIIRIESDSVVDVAVEGFTVVEGATGVEVLGKTKATLTNVQASNNFSGLSVGDLAVVSLTNSQISGNEHAGFTVWDSAQVTLSNSQVFNNSDGLFVWDSAQLELKESVVSYNKGCGLWVRDREARVTGPPNEMHGNGTDLCGFAPSSSRKPRQPEDPTKTLLRVPEDYRDIQEAVDAVAKGGTILLAAGTYETGLTLWKPLTLQGVGQEQTMLKALPERGLVISIIAEAQGVRLEGLAVTGSYDGLFVYGQVTLKGIQVSESKNSGLDVRGSAQVILTNSQVSNNWWDGLWVSGSATVSVTSSQLSGNEWAGLEVGGSATVVVRSSIIEDNGTHEECKEIDRICNGIKVGGKSQTTITESKIINNTDWGLAARLKKCGYKEDDFTGKVTIDDKTVIEGNNRAGNHKGNPGWTGPPMSDGQVCLP